jgi:anti-sigma factor RsiW
MAVSDDLACKEFVEEVTDYLEDALSPDERARFEAHLEVCPYCVEYFGQVEAVRGALGDGVDGLAPETRSALLDEFRSRKL